MLSEIDNSPVSLLVGTRKGAWILTSDEGRSNWQIKGPILLGNIVNHIVLDYRDNQTMLMSARTGHLGPTIFRSRDFGESWQSTCARELYEETGIRISADNIREYRVRSSEDNMLIIFGLSETQLHESDLPPFSVTRETSERRIAFQPISLAFPLHTETMAAYFKNQIR